MRMRKDKVECLARDKICRICGEDNLEELTLHHIYPKGHKNRNKIWAKSIICKRCHRYINEFWDKTEIEVQRRRGLRAGAGI